MVTTVQSAAAELSIPHQRIRHYMKRGIVSYKRAGGVYLVDADMARQAMKDAGYDENLTAYRERMTRAAARRQAE